MDPAKWFFNEMRTELVLNSHRLVNMVVLWMMLVCVTVIQQVRLKINKLCWTYELCEVRLRVHSREPFIQNHSQENRNQTHGRRGWLFATCDSFGWEKSLHVTEQAWLWIWFILRFWVSAHTHHGPRADALWSKARVIKSVSAEVNWNDGQMAVTQSTTQPVSFFVSVIQCSHMTFAHMSYGGILFAQLCDDSLNCHHHNVACCLSLPSNHSTCLCVCHINPPRGVVRNIPQPVHSVMLQYLFTADWLLYWMNKGGLQTKDILLMPGFCVALFPPSSCLWPKTYSLHIILSGGGGSGVFFTLHPWY